MINKAFINNLKVNYHKAPLRIYEVGLAPGPVAVYNYLASCGENYHPSYRQIAKVFGISKNTAMKYVEILINRNIIRLVSKGKKDENNIYAFTNPDKWVAKKEDS